MVASSAARCCLPWSKLCSRWYPSGLHGVEILVLNLPTRPPHGKHVVIILRLAIAVFAHLTMRAADLLRGEELRAVLGHAH